MVNEIVDWYKKKKKKLMVFKIDSEKTYEIVFWNFLETVMIFMGFGPTWMGWIRGCLYSAKASVLVNGSQSVGFQLQRGLCQGDTLSPLLFILLMEALHVAVEEVIDAGFFKAAKIGSLYVSHLLYEDDMLFIGECSRENIISIVRLLKCFYKVSVLKLNIHKSN